MCRALVVDCNTYECTFWYSNVLVRRERVNCVTRSWEFQSLTPLLLFFIQRSISWNQFTFKQIFSRCGYLDSYSESNETQKYNVFHFQLIRIHVAVNGRPSAPLQIPLEFRFVKINQTFREQDSYARHAWRSTYDSEIRRVLDRFRTSEWFYFPIWWLTTLSKFVGRAIQRRNFISGSMTRAKREEVTSYLLLLKWRVWLVMVI